jgi:hypothetical protein
LGALKKIELKRNLEGRIDGGKFLALSLKL